jgi:hypothetical protein
MNPIIPLGAVALALAGFMFWKKDNYTDYQYPPATPVVPPDFAPPAILPAPLAPYVPPAFAGQPPIDYGDEGGDWFVDNYVAPVYVAPVYVDPFAGQPPIDYGDEGGDWFVDNYVPPAPGYDYGPNIEPWTKADNRRFDSFNGFQTMEMWNIDPDAVDPHIGKPGYLGNNMWDLLDRSPVPVQGAIDPHIGKPGYLGNGMWDMLYRGTGASEQAYWSGYGEG